MAAVVREIAAIGRDRRFFEEQTRFRKACDWLQRPTISRHPMDVTVTGLYVQPALTRGPASKRGASCARSQ